MEKIINSFRVTIFGRPIAKKNNARIVRFGGRSCVIPSKAYCAYEKEALKQLKTFPTVFPDEYLHVVCEYWLPDHRWFPDLLNLMSASHDILEKSGIITNDKYIVSVDGSRIMGFSKNNPRVDIYLEPVKYDYAEVC